jgi:hypothetical protein
MATKRIWLGDAVTAHSAATALAAIPVTYADLSQANLPKHSNGVEGHSLVEVEIEGSTTIAASAMVVNGMIEDAFSLTGAVTFTNATELVNKNTHGMRTGAGPFYFTNSGGLLPAELDLETPYYAIYNNANSFKVAASRALAFAGTAISIGDDGTGTHGILTLPEATNPEWMQYVRLGIAGDGAIALILHKGYAKLFDHNPRFTAYSVSGTLDAGNVTVKFRPGRTIE